MRLVQNLGQVSGTIPRGRSYKKMTEAIAFQHIIASVVLRLAYLATGLLFCYFGKGLLEKGICGSFSADGAAASNKFKIVISSPGLVFAVAGMVIILMAINRQSIARFPTAGPAKTSKGDTQQADVFSGYDLAVPTELGNLAMDRYETAVTAAEQRGLATAKHALMLAVLLDPSLLKNAQENPVLADILQDREFQTILRHRIGVSLSAAQEVKELSAKARKILSWFDMPDGYTPPPSKPKGLEILQSVS